MRYDAFAQRYKKPVRKYNKTSKRKKTVIHYNNGEKEKLIKDVLCISVIDGNNPVTVNLRNGNELQIRLDNIEMILDDEIRSDIT